MPGVNVEMHELRDLLEMVPEVVVVVDPDRSIRYINRIGDTGRERPDVIGVDMLEFLPPELREQQKEIFERVLDTMEPTSFEIPIVAAEGEEGEEWYEGTMTPLIREGRVTGVAVMTRNVTGRRLAEQEAEALRRLVPVCSWCHRVRDEEGEWQDLESYVEKKSGSHVSHGMCPECEREVVAEGNRESA